MSDSDPNRHFVIFVPLFNFGKLVEVWLSDHQRDPRQNFLLAWLKTGETRCYIDGSPDFFVCSGLLLFDDYFQGERVGVAVVNQIEVQVEIVVPEQLLLRDI